MRTAPSFVDLPAAQSARGLRLVVMGGVPSPWSEAAKGLFRVKGVPHVLVRLMPGDNELRKWTRARNAPAAMNDDEPARTGWGDILELAERLGPAVPLVPSDPGDRVRMFGLAHELMGEGGLAWSARLLAVDAGLRTNGAQGFLPFAAQYLAARYGYVPERMTLCLARLAEGFALFERALGAGPYYFGDRLTALDLYSAAALNVLRPLPEALCPMLPPIRAAFESMRSEIDVPPSMIAHRQRVYEEHMGLPMVL